MSRKTKQNVAHLKCYKKSPDTYGVCYGTHITVSIIYKLILFCTLEGLFSVSGGGKTVFPNGDSEEDVLGEDAACAVTDKL